MPRPRDLADHARVRVHVPEVIGTDDNGKPIVRLDETRSMLLARADYKKNAKYYGPVLEDIQSGKEPKPWAPAT